MIGTELLILFVCMVGSAFYSGMETGVISINRIRLRHYVNAGSKKADILQAFLDHPDRLLGSTLLGTNICNVMVSVVLASLAVQMSEVWGATISSVLATVLLLIFGEYMPKAWFQAQPLTRCARFTMPLQISWLIMRPVVALLTWITRLIVPAGDSVMDGDGTFVTKDELKVLAHEVETGGMLSKRERDMIHSVMELSRRTAKDIMIPRARMATLPSSATVGDLYAKITGSGYTRLPVVDDASGRMTGIVNVFDVVASEDVEETAPITSFIRNAIVVPDLMPVDDILPRLRAGRQRVCLIRDRESEVVGLITTEDILVEIVGEL